MSGPIPDIAETQRLKASDGRRGSPPPPFHPPPQPSPQGLVGVTKIATQRPGRPISQGWSPMVPMEIFPLASKEPSLLKTLEFMPSFQPLGLSLSSGLPPLLPGTTVEISPQSCAGVSPHLLIHPACDSRITSVPSALIGCPGEGTKPHCSSGPLPWPRPSPLSEHSVCWTSHTLASGISQHPGSSQRGGLVPSSSWKWGQGGGDGGWGRGEQSDSQGCL